MSRWVCQDTGTVSNGRRCSGVRVFVPGGFTIIELVTVMILLGILSITAISRFVEPSAFAPGIVTHAVVLEIRAAQQLAASRADAQVTFVIDRAADDWRLQIQTDLEGVVSSELIAAENTSLSATSGAASAAVNAATPLVVQFDKQGDLSSVTIGASAGSPATGVDLEVSGDSDRRVCIYPTGYATDAACS